MFLFKIILLFSLSIFTFASEEIKKTGFFTNEDCLKKGHFKDCSLDSFSCGYEGCFKDFEPTYHTEDNFVLYVHKDRKYYKLDTRAITAMAVFNPVGICLTKSNTPSIK